MLLRRKIVEYNFVFYVCHFSFNPPDAFSMIMKEANPKERRENFLEVKKVFYSYIISIMKEKVSAYVENSNEYIPFSDLKREYDEETGFII